jgi:hypothetical protein
MAAKVTSIGGRGPAISALDPWACSAGRMHQLLTNDERAQLAVMSSIALMKVALDEAWNRLPPKLQATMLKTSLAERILKSAAAGERDRKRLREAALRDLAA